jgi:hypothetical protein
MTHTQETTQNIEMFTLIDSIRVLFCIDFADNQNYDLNLHKL